MEAHLFAVELEDPRGRPPFIALLVSGGHTLLLRVPRWGEYHLLGETRDDAAGEAFDKAAKLLGLDYPGGPAIEAAARGGDPRLHPLPRPLLANSTRPDHPDYYDFSYSGLKTALRTRIRQLEADGGLEDEVPHLAAAFQEAAIDVLVAKTARAIGDSGYDRVVLGGGVANSLLLRQRLSERLPETEILFPSPRLATDNAAMVARAGRFRFDEGQRGDLDLNAMAGMSFPGLLRRAG
jgi:N6-L-threonylcarbamoyladenine synthase